MYHFNNIITCFNIRFLCDKVKFSQFFAFKNYIPLTVTRFNNHIFSNNIKLKLKNHKFFIKPSNGSCGNDILITYNPFNKLKKNMIAQKEIVTKLYNGRKWDLRIYIVHEIKNNKFRTYMYKNGLVRLAPEKYNESTSVRALITNTSKLNTFDNYDDLNFPFSNYDNYKYYMKKIQYIMKDIHKHIKNNIKFNKSLNISEFQLFGYDFIISKNDDIFLLEINRSPHSILSRNSEAIKSMKYDIYKCIYNKFIKLNIIKENKIIFNDNFVKI